MAEANETLSILNAEARRQMEIKRDKELYIIRKLLFVLDYLQKIKVNKLDLPDNGEQVMHALKVLDVNNFLQLIISGGDEYLLGLKEIRDSVNLSYTERKAIREELIALLRLKLQPIIDFGKKLKAEIPDVFADPSAMSPTTTTSSSASQIIALESQRRSNLHKLLEARNRKCAYLKAAGELKMGPYLAHELELLYAQGKLTQEKANILRDYFINEFLTRTEHSSKALKEIENCVDKKLEMMAEVEQS
ncbi:augmin complex subunit dgt2 isoform X2 [Anastrepha ludens]|nr:augmin complex subunit dgt2 isoform X2 [Anastrepha ludens]